MAGWAAAFLWFFVSYNWVSNSISRFGGVTFPLDMAAISLMAGIHALYPALFSSLIPHAGRLRIWVCALVLPSAWVVLELGRSLYPAPFPWLHLGSAFWKVPVLRSLYPFAGVFGASFYIVLVNVLVWRLTGAPRGSRRGILSSLVLLALLPAAAALFQGAQAGSVLKVGVIQGNFQQEVKWREELQEETVTTYLELTDAAVARGARLVVWPETAVPVFFQAEPEVAQRLLDYVSARDVHLVFGSPGYEIRDDKVLLYNRVYHLSPSGDVEHYDKINLVPFGEYVPFSRLLPFVDKLVPGEGEFARGVWKGPFSTQVPSGPLVCYEVTFPWLARREVRDGSRILINVTNDAWFGRSWGPYQHLAISAVRAAENGVPLIRAANTGVSALVDGRGVLAETIPLGERDVIVAQVRTGGKMTVYTRFGDWIVILAFGVITIHSLIFLFTGRSRKWTG
ncbi:MAG: apolipoprotein N-acyltransferase [bacterium]|nr:MAG: apolipoprotein N-acyltransferase [bacterium]